MKTIKILIIAATMFFLFGCNSPKASTEKYQSAKTDIINNGDDYSLNVNESLNEIKVNIDKAYEVGNKEDSTEADKYINNAMEAVKQYLSNNDDDSIDIGYLDSISFIKASENSDYILVEFDKHYTHFGGGTTGTYTSWKVIKYKPYNLVEIFEKNSPFLSSLDTRMVMIDENPILFIYGKCSWDKAQLLRIQTYKIDKTGVTKVQPLKCKTNNGDLWECREEDGVIKTKEYMNKIFEYISDDAKEVRISADDGKHVLKLNLNESGVYEIASME
jgi:hypothetical protein